jgi:hypothetical protein
MCVLFGSARLCGAHADRLPYKPIGIYVGSDYVGSVVFGIYSILETGSNFILCELL